MHQFDHEKLKVYQESIRSVDHSVGIVLDALKLSAQAENTLVVLWSDHGFHLGENSTGPSARCGKNPHGFGS